MNQKPTAKSQKLTLILQNTFNTFTGNNQEPTFGKTSVMCYMIDIQLFSLPIYIFLVWVVLVLCGACCTTRQQLVLRSLGSNLIGQKPARPGPLIFEAVGRLVLSVGKAVVKKKSHLLQSTLSLKQNFIL